MSAIILAAAYATAGREGHRGHGPHDGYEPPSPEQMGGAYSFSDVNGGPVAAADFEGAWTLLFFGYSRCRGSCPIAIPKIIQVAHRLRDQGLDARAVFVDIDSPPLGMIRRRNGAGPVHADHDLDRIAAMRALAKRFGGELRVLNGTRSQLSAAARAFKVAREHTPPRNGEEGHSINHSTMIYFIAPDTKVAGYGYHDADLEELTSAMMKLALPRVGEMLPDRL
jgi:protein SCO1